MTFMGAIDRLNGPCTECGPPTHVSGQLTLQESLSFARQAGKGSVDFCDAEVRFREEIGPSGDAFPFQLRSHSNFRIANASYTSLQKGSVNRMAEGFGVEILSKDCTACQSDLLGPITHDETIAYKGEDRILKTQPSERTFARAHLLLIAQAKTRNPVSAPVMNAHARAIFQGSSPQHVILF
jgi:hypothetical protein